MKIGKVIPFALVAVMLLFSGCGKKVMENQSATDEDLQPTVESEPVVAEEATQDSDGQGQLPQPDAATMFSDEVIFFDYDSDMLTAEAQSILQIKAQWIRDNPNVVSLLIEGHCDSRGTDAYNMALGERRAEAVKNYLIDLGVDVGILETQSYGEEKPAVNGEDESSWSQNRRAAFILN